jgi:hypothetical protein
MTNPPPGAHSHPIFATVNRYAFFIDVFSASRSRHSDRSKSDVPSTSFTRSVLPAPSPHVACACESTNPNASVGSSPDCFTRYCR